MIFENALGDGWFSSSASWVFWGRYSGAPLVRAPSYVSEPAILLVAFGDELMLF